MNGDKKCGFGIRFYKNEIIYLGYFKDNKLDKYGLYKWDDDSTYMGEFVSSCPCGNCVLIKSNGITIEG